MNFRALLLSFAIATVAATPVSAKQIIICDLSKPEPNCTVYPDVGTAGPEAGERFSLQISKLTKEEVLTLQQALKTLGVDIPFDIPK